VAIAFDDAGSAAVAAGTTTDIAGATHGLTVGSGADRVLLVGYGQGNSAAAVTSMAWDQAGTPQALTKIGERSMATDARAELWRLVNPTPGNKTLRIVRASSAGAVSLIALTGVDQTTPNGTAVLASGTGNPTLAVASEAGDLVVDFVVKKETGGTAFVAGAGQTEPAGVEVHANANDEGCSMSYEAGAASVTMSWTGPTEEWCQIGVNVNAAAAAAGPFPLPWQPPRQYVRH
jgi:hypothetical protein